MTDRRELAYDGRIDLAATVFPLRRGHGDPTMRIDGARVTVALRTPDGPAVLSLRQTGPDRVLVEATGVGASAALALAPGVAGALDDPHAFSPPPGFVRDLARRSGVRLTRAPLIPVLVAAVLEQKVTGMEARRAWRGLVFATSEPAAEGLWLPPDPERVASLPSFAFRRIGVDGKREATVRLVAARAERIAGEAAHGSGAFRSWIERLPGIGPWTSAEAARLGLGDPDAVSVGDFHLPNVVAWVLAGEPRADDARMLELLEPYVGQRGRVQRLVEASHASAPAFGPRQEARSIATW